MCKLYDSNLNSTWDRFCVKIVQDCNLARKIVECAILHNVIFFFETLSLKWRHLISHYPWALILFCSLSKSAASSSSLKFDLFLSSLFLSVLGLVQWLPSSRRVLLGRPPLRDVGQKIHAIVVFYPHLRSYFKSNNSVSSSLPILYPPFSPPNPNLKLLQSSNNQPTPIFLRDFASTST